MRGWLTALATLPDPPPFSFLLAFSGRNVDCGGADSDAKCPPNTGE